MAIAYQSVSRAELDSAAASLAQTLRDGCSTATKLKALLDIQTDEVLAGYGYTVDDIYLLRLLVQDLAQLAAVAHGGQAQATAMDFFAHSNLILGLR
jgi:hypothetical protein